MGARLVGVVAVMEDEHPLGEEEGEEPDADQDPDALWESPTLSNASGSTSKSATATTTPPVSAIRVGSECESRSPSAPPANVATTVAQANGMAIHSIGRGMIIILIDAMLRAWITRAIRAGRTLALEALAAHGRRAGGGRQAVDLDCSPPRRAV